MGYNFCYILWSLRAVRTMTPLAPIRTARCRPVQIFPFARPIVLSVSHFQSRWTAPKGSLSRPSAFLIEWKYRALSTAISVPFVCTLLAGCSLYCCSSSSRGKDSSLSIASISMVLFAGFASLTVRACTGMPTQASTYLLLSSPQPLTSGSKQSLHIWLLDFQIAIGYSAFTPATPSENHPHLLFAHQSVLLLAMMSQSHRIIEFLQILTLTLCGVISRTLLSVTWHQVASCSTSSYVYATFRCALPIANSIDSCWVGSSWFNVTGARFDPTIRSKSASCSLSTTPSVIRFRSQNQWHGCRLLWTMLWLI